MTIDKRDTINIPKWLLLLVIPIVLGGISGFGTSMYALGKNNRQVEVNTKRLETIETLKADKETTNAVLVQINSSLYRIENKLDNHINGDNKQK